MLAQLPLVDEGQDHSTHRLAVSSTSSYNQYASLRGPYALLCSGEI